MTEQNEKNLEKQEKHQTPLPGVTPRNIEDEMKVSFIDYSMSVIMARALPDARDGLKPVHRRILYTMKEMGLRHNAAYKKSARVVGECFVKDTLVVTDKGLVPIQNIQKGDFVYTQNGVERVTELYEMPEKKLLKVVLENGLSNVVTESQKFKIIDENLQYRWKEAKELSENDYIVLRATYPDIKKEVPLSKLNGFAPFVNKNVAYLLGQLISDGWIEKGYNHGKGYRLGFCSSSERVIQKIGDILREEFEYNPTIEIKNKKLSKKTKTLYTIRVNNSAVNDFIVSAFNLQNVSASTKFIPSQIFTSPKEVIFAFISGLMDGDGSIHAQRNAIHYGSVSERLIDGLLILLQSFGIIGKKHSDFDIEIVEKPFFDVILSPERSFGVNSAKNPEKCHSEADGHRLKNLKDEMLHFIQHDKMDLFQRSHIAKKGRAVMSRRPFHYIEIRSEQAAEFASLLELYDLSKKERLRKIKFNKINPDRFDVIPFIGKKIFEELSNKHLGGGWYLGSDGKKFRMGIKYPTGSKIRYSSDIKEKCLSKKQIENWRIKEKLKKIGSPLYDFISEVLENKVYFVRVSKIIPATPQATFDIQVANAHEFIANGMLSHNCLGKYHPHGDTAVYDAMVRMAQNFSLRYPLVDGQGNFGSIDGDSPAAMRYTEVRLENISDEMLSDLDKETVDFGPNYDGSLEEPLILPAKLPNLLINGSSGIAVGMATNIPPHNLSEVIDGILAVIDNPEITVQEISKIIKGPDFPTAGIIQGKSGIKSYLETGRGSIKIRAKAEIEEMKGNREAIIITELPYQVNKAALLEAIADLVKDKKLDGISDLRDESDRKGMRIVVELKRDANAQIVLNQLFKHTQMEISFGVIMLAIVDGKPKILNIKQMLENYIEHRKVVVVRRTKFELKKAEARAHILEGLKIALDHLDAVIKTIKESKDVDTARERLMEKFKLTKIQAQAILDMKLQQLTNLERKKIDDEYLDLIKLIEKLKSILADPRKVLGVIKEELVELKEKYGDARMTKIAAQTVELDEEDLIQHEEVAVMLSHAGYIKRIPLSTYRAQGRGGRGITGMTTKDEDFVEHLFTTDTHAYLLLFTNKGRCHWLRVYEIPEGTRTAKGKAIVNFIQIGSDEKITAAIPIKSFDEKKESFLLMATKIGMIKKTPLSEYSNPRKGGIIAINLESGDELIDVKHTDGESEVIIATQNGIAIRFKESDVRCIGRAGKGVRGIKLEKNDFVVGMEAVKKDDVFLSATENGYGKRTEVGKYRLQSRGGKGVRNIKTTDRNGKVVGIKKALDADDLMLMTQKGIAIRLACSSVSVIGRNVQGVRLVRLEEGDKLSAIATVVKEENSSTSE